MKNRVFCALAVGLALPALLGLGLGVQSALAKVDPGWDWHKVDGKPKRHLHYCIDPKLDENLPDGGIDWVPDINEAAREWNNADTGWQLEKVDWGDPKCQVKITYGETGGDIATTGCEPPGWEGEKTGCTITFDPTPGKRGRTWGYTDTTYDPRCIAKHEFGHVLRLDHTATGIMRAQFSPDDDAPTLDQGVDIPEAKAAAKGTIEKAEATITPGGGGTVVVKDFYGSTLATVLIPPNAVESDTTVWAGVQGAVSAPYPDSVPAGMVTVFRLLYLHDEFLQPIQLLLPAQIQINYGDLFQGTALAGEAVDQDPVVPTGSGLPGISEDSLILLRDLGNDGDWDVDGSLTPSIDSVAKTVTVSTDLLDAYAVSGFPQGPVVGGAGEIPVSQGGSSASSAQGSGTSAPPYALIAGGAAAALGIVAGGWYARRRLS